jgi:hypothetical protein
MADSYWIDVVPPRLLMSPKGSNVGNRSFGAVGADSYSIENVGSDSYNIERVGNKAFEAVGADDYIINPGRVGDRTFSTSVGGTYGHKQSNRRARGGYYQSEFWDGWPIYIIVNENVVCTEDNAQLHGPIASTISPSTIPNPDNVGGIDPTPAWVHAAFQAAGKDKTKQYNASFAKALFSYYIASPKVDKKTIEPEMLKPNGVALDPNNSYWQATPSRRNIFRAITPVAKKIAAATTTTTTFAPGQAITHVAGDIVHTVNAAADFAGKALAHVPVVGNALSSTLKIMTAPVGLVNNIASGQRIDHAFINSAKQQITAVRAVAPYVQQVLSFVPGVGTGAAAAIAAGVALSEGRTITEAVIAATKAAVPGGIAGQAAFGSALSLMSGKNVKDVALDAARAALPPSAQKAFDVGVALGHGKNIQSKVINAVTAAVPTMAKVGLDTIKKSPVLANAAKGLSADAAKGYQTAIGVLSHTGVNAHAVMALRSKLTPKQQEGFDHGAKTIVAQHTPNWPSLVVNGIVTRGDWKACRPGAKGCTTGHIIQNGKVTKGTFSRA